MGKGDFLLHFTSRVNTPNKIIINDDAPSVYLSLATSGGCYYQAINGIHIGEGTIWSYGCHFISSNHSYRDLSKHSVAQPINIGKYVWIASGVIILPGVEIGDYVIVGAGSVVTKNIPAYSIVVGNPAKAIAKRCKICYDKIPLAGGDICNLCD